MRWPSFERANQFGDAVRRKRYAYLLGFCSALPAVLLTLNIGLIAHLLLNRNGGARTPQNWLLQRMASEDVAAWGWWGRADYYLLALIAAFLLLALIEFLLRLFYLRAADKAALRTVCRLQSAIYEQTPRVGLHEGGAERAFHVEHLLTDSSDCLRRGLASWWRAFPRGISLIGLLLVLALVFDYLLTLLIVLLAVFVWRVCRRAERRIAGEAERDWDHAGRRHETMLGQIRVVRAMAACSQEAAPKAAFDEALRRYRHDAERAIANQARMRPLLLLLLASSVALLALIIGLSPYTSLTDVVILACVFARILFPLQRVDSTLEAVDSAEQAAAEIFTYLDRTSPVGQIAGATSLTGITREVRLDGVCVAGGSGGVLLDGISLSFPAGQRTAVLSSRDETWRALVELILRFRDPDAGRILLDDVDIRTVSFESLRERIAIASADGMLFTGTVAENVRCGRSGFRAEDVEEAARLCHVFDAIGELPHNFQTTIGPEGRALAPTVAFLVGLARAVLTDPSLIIIQEPPQPIDNESDALIQAAIEQVSDNRTLILLPTRLPTLRDAQNVLVFHEGKLHAQGPHPELLKGNDLYRHLNYKLFNPFRHV